MYLGKCKHCGGLMWRDSQDRLVCETPPDVCLCELPEEEEERSDESESERV
jgi:hypothetical protein